MYLDLARVAKVQNQDDKSKVDPACCFEGQKGSMVSLECSSRARSSKAGERGSMYSSSCMQAPAAILCRKKAQPERYAKKKLQPPEIFCGLAQTHSRRILQLTNLPRASTGYVVLCISYYQHQVP